MRGRSILLGFVLLTCQSAHAAGAACFTYETFQHPLPVPGAANQALIDYDYTTILARNAVIPPIGVGALQLSVSLKNALPLWNHAIAPLGAALTLQQACQVAMNRQNIGIRISFANPAIILLVSAGMPMPPGAAGYVNNALRGGGYFSPLAAALFRLRNNIPQPNFVMLPGGAIADRVILHFHLPVRVSKNLKELSFNSVLVPALPGMAPYISIKDMIDAQFAGLIAILGVPLPYHSATIVSSDFLQPN